MKKLLFVNASLTVGGSERVMTILANAAAELGHDVTMILLREKEKDTYILDERVNCVRFRYGTSNKLFIALKRIPKLRAYIKKNRPDAVISFMHDINVTTLLSALGLNQSIIVSERNNPNARNESRFYKKLVHWSYLRAKKVVFQTDQVRDMFPDDIKSISAVIPNPVNMDIPSPLEGERDKRIVAAGRLTAQKNFPMLIRAYAKFHETHPDYRLVIYGAGELQKELLAEAEKTGLSDSISFPGYVQNVNECMRSAAMYVSSSDFEGISNSMIEAMAMGVPAICTDCPVGGAAMMIENNINGILVPVGDESALCSAMTTVADDPVLARTLSKNAIMVKNLYSAENIVKRWLELVD